MARSFRRVGLGLAFLTSAGLFGQGKSPLPMFEAASIKPSAPPTDGGIRVMMGQSPGRINWSNVSILNCIMNAYDVKGYQVTGPAWLDQERFDIVATYPAGTSSDNLRLMIQALLAERFHLANHRETKEQPMYALVVAKGGLRMKESPAEEAIDDGPGGRGGRGGTRIQRGRGHLEGGSVPMGALANQLAGLVDRAVVDQSGLTGNYEFKLDFTPEGALPRAGEGDGHGVPETSSIFTAVQEQLGLKLEPRRGPIEMLIVDRVEKLPTEN